VKEKPILQMGDIERERAFDGIAESINADLLSEARSGGHDPIVLAAVVLISGDGSRRIVTYNGEYGDGDGIAQMKDLVRQLRRSNKLLAGESVEAIVLEKPTDQFQWRPL